VLFTKCFAQKMAVLYEHLVAKKLSYLLHILFVSFVVVAGGAVMNDQQS